MRRLSRLRPLAGSTSLALLLLMARGAGAAAVPEPPQVGGAVRDFGATSVQGQSFSLDEALEGHKALVVLFLSTMCPYAKYFAAHIRELDERYGPQGVLFLGVNSNDWESTVEVIEHARKMGFGFPMVKDEGGAIADRLGATATPEAFLIDASGRLRYRGWIKSKQESPDLQRAIDAVLEGRPVRRPQTRTFGCAVDRH